MQIKELKAGSQHAFAQLVQEYSHTVVNTCYAFLRNHEDAEDVAQEVFLEIYKSIKGFREDAGLSTWIHRIAVNKSLDAIRRRKRKKRLADATSLLLLQKRRKQKEAAAKCGPDEKIEADERREILQEQINKLPNNQRIALVLSKYEGLANRRIGRIMATSESAVEALLHRAKRNLRKRLENYYEKNL